MDNFQLMLTRFKAFEQMYSYEKRLQTFSDWPFREDCLCTPEQMAKAGFVHCPSENEPDVACCFFCLRELEGWEPQDDPWAEHIKRTPNCPFLLMKKDYGEMTLVDHLHLSSERLNLFLDALGRSLVEM
ncbi:baculoviral IAP repeat-containing protein 5b isoform X2 [Clupea harengus]|uniref:Baculoviral IAP repeat-containing protein 5b isoform X2 n=1 Tax=Clupea harengus TaxID=7950 RepID=A0A6P8EZG0_CLUHA|nr:baculoviral IAP repeat-containing protein 5b isoform X2 [Clupea harengus]